MDKIKMRDPYYVMSKIEQMQKAKIPEKEIAEQLGFPNTMQLRMYKSGFHGGSRVVYVRWAKYLKEEGKSVSEIAQIIGKNESSVRLLLDGDLMKKLEEA